MDIGYLKQRMDHHLVQGLSLAIIADGEISETICLGYREQENHQAIIPTTLFHACSISKFLTAIIVLKLVDEKVLSLDDDVNNYLSSWTLPDGGFSKVTIRHLLSHQSGIVDPEGSFSELDKRIEFPSILDVLEGRTPYHHGPVRLSVEPGTQFRYSDAGFCILQVVIEDVMKKPIHEVASEMIFEPLQLINSTLSPAPAMNVAYGHTQHGQPVKGRYPIYPYPAASGLWATPSELAAMVVEIFRSLEGESRIGLTSETVREMIHPQGGFDWTGLGLFLDQTEYGTEISSLGWGVGFQSAFVAMPDWQSGLVVMTNTDTGIHQMEGLIGEIFQLFLSGLKDKQASC